MSQNMKGVSIVTKSLSYQLPVGRSEWKPILKAIDLCIAAGHLVALMGPSGSGKTSLLNVLSGRVISEFSNEVSTRETDDSEDGKSTSVVYSSSSASSENSRSELTMNFIDSNFQTSSPQKIVEGKIWYDGRQDLVSQVKQLSGFCMQEDLLHEYLTVEETLMFATRLKLKRLSKDEQRNKVEKLIQQLRLSSCRNTLIGGPMAKGVSGGEKKRVSIGLQLILSPKVLFLDEPTSGLDSAMAYDVVRVIRNLARNQGTTVVCTIHQPRSQIFEMFQDLVLLSNGQVVYQGDAHAQLADYCASVLRMPIPSNMNPADFILDMVTPQGKRQQNLSFDKNSSVSVSAADSKAEGSLIRSLFSSREGHQQRSWSKSYGSFVVPEPSVPGGEITKWNRHAPTEKQIQKLPVLYQSSKCAEIVRRKTKHVLKQERSTDDTLLSQEAETRWSTRFKDWFTSVRILCSKTLLEVLRDPDGFIVEFVVEGILAIMFGAFFFQSKYPQPDPDTGEILCNAEDYHNLGGGLMSIICEIAFANMLATTYIPVNRERYNREIDDQQYTRGQCFTAFTSTLALFDFVMPLTFSIVCYWMYGYPASFTIWLAFFLTMYLTRVASVAFAYFLGAVNPNVLLTLMTAPMGNVFFTLTAGLITPVLPSWISWFKYVCYHYYSYTAALQWIVGDDDYLRNCGYIIIRFEKWGNTMMILVCAVLYYALALFCYMVLYKHNPS